MHSYLNHLNEVNNISFICNFSPGENDKIVIVEIEYELTKINEHCHNDEFIFNNIYWVDNDGFIWKSDQWLNKDVKAKVSIIKSIKEF